MPTFRCECGAVLHAGSEVAGEKYSLTGSLTGAFQRAACFTSLSPQ